MSQHRPAHPPVHLAGAEPYELGDEIWQQSLPDAIRAEAEIIADYAGPNLLRLPGLADRPALRDRVVAEMTVAVRQAGDPYTAPDRVAYTLTHHTQLDLTVRQDTPDTMSPGSAPIVAEVLRFEDLPVGSSATRAAIVRWSDAGSWPRRPPTTCAARSADPAHGRMTRLTGG